MRIAIDAMGGDYAPLVTLKGSCQAAKHFPDLELILVGQCRVLENIIKKEKMTLPSSISLCDAEEVIQMGDSPATAVRRKKKSSIVVAVDLVKKGQADALVTAGNTGAAVAATTLRWRLLEGIGRAGIALTFPSHGGNSLLIDAGANLEARSSHYFHFAIMGKIYSEILLKKKSVRIALLNVGEEDGKGRSEIKETFHLFKNSYFNFVGNIEGSDIFKGRCDVIVTDGFVGNIVLKVAEGTASTFTQTFKRELKKTFLSRIGALFCLPAFFRLKKRFDYAEYGGAPLLGVNGVCFISHGSSNGRAIFNAIRMASEFSRYDVNAKIVQEIKEHGHA